MNRREACGKQFADGESCTLGRLEMASGSILARVRYAGATPCPACGVADGGIHHFQCNREICPRCDALLTDCNCF
jgi:hypothetical protein